MTARYCDFCGKEIPLHAKVCPYCKKLLKETETKREIDEPTKKLDISKYISSDSRPGTGEHVDETNIYSFSSEEIEMRFAPKEVRRQYDEELWNEKEEKAQKTPVAPRRTPPKKTKKPLIICACVGIIVFIVLIILIINPFTKRDTSLKDLNNQKTSATTASTTAATTETTQETTTSTTAPTTIYEYSVDLDGYLGIDFANVEEDFGAQQKEPQIDEFYGGEQYFYDGLTLSTSTKGGILSVKVDYTTASNKDIYRYRNITYYSTYDSVLAEMGKPELSQLDDPNEPCIGYNLGEGTSSFIKILFDSNKKVNGFEIFYADD